MSARARDHVWLVALVYFFRACVGALMAMPVAILLGGASSADPRGTATLFDPGGLMLLEALRLSHRGAPAVLAGAAAIGVVALVLSVLPLGVVLTGLARRDRVSLPDLAGASVRHAPTLVILGALGALMQILVVAVVVIVGGRLAGSLGSVASSARSEDIALSLAFVAALGGASVVGIARDVASTVAVREELRLYSACTVALDHLRAAGGRLLLAWSWRAALSVGVILAVGWATPSGRVAAWHAVLVAFALHQWAVAAASALHVSWLAAVMRVVDGADAR